MDFKLILLAILSVLFFSCSNEEEEPGTIMPGEGNYIIFGNVFGACTGDCRELYLLQDDNLYTDSNNPVDESVTFNPDPLPQESYTIADTLWQVPTSLQSNTYNPGALIQTISDFDYYVEGRIDDSNFSIEYDNIDSIFNPELYQYGNAVKYVIDQLD